MMKTTPDSSGMLDLSDILTDIPAPVMQIPDFSPDLPIIGAAGEKKDLFADSRRKKWHADSADEARCDFATKIRLSHRGVYFISLWQKSLFGRTLSDIKSDDEMIPTFATQVARLIQKILGSHLSPDDYALVTTPRRRHRERNFATLVSIQIAGILGIPFYEDAATARTRQRVNDVFHPANIPPHRNIIVFDDIVSTGSTLAAMKNLLDAEGKNSIYFTGINNILR